MRNIQNRLNFQSVLVQTGVSAHFPNSAGGLATLFSLRRANYARRKRFAMYLIYFSVAVGLTSAPNVRATDLFGSDDRALQTAIEVWLEDNDKESLPIIAEIAAEGNIAARILLARIEETDRGPSDYVSSLSRKERVQLFRSTSGKGVFRPSWLKSEMEAGNQIATALLKSSALEVNIDAIRTLYKIGEPEATYDLIKQVAANGSQEDKENLVEFLPEASELFPYLQALQVTVAGNTPGHTALSRIISNGNSNNPGKVLEGPEDETEAAAVFVEFGYHALGQAAEFNETNSYYNGMANWIDSVPETKPISILCHRYCDNEQINYCTVTVFGLVGGYYKAIRFDSPIESMIEQTKYLSSDRAAGMMLRRISRVKSANGNLLISDHDLQKKSACLAKAVIEERV